MRLVFSDLGDFDQNIASGDGRTPVTCQKLVQWFHRAPRRFLVLFALSNWNVACSLVSSEVAAETGVRRFPKPTSAER
jgi:hypothetical protein